MGMEILGQYSDGIEVESLKVRNGVEGIGSFWAKFVPKAPLGRPSALAHCLPEMHRIKSC